METSKLAPPSRKEIIGITGRDVFEALVNRGDLIEISEGVIFPSQSWNQWKEPL